MPCDGALVIRMSDSAGVLHSVGFINSKGESRHFSSGHPAGCYYGIDGDKNVIVVATRFIVAASCSEATGAAAAVAFGSENLADVAQSLHSKYPLAQIIIAADNDGDIDRKLRLQAAYAAAWVVNGLVAVPELGGRACDFNDLARALGPEAVREAITSAQPPVPAQVIHRQRARTFAALRSPEAAGVDPSNELEQQSFSDMQDVQKLVGWVRRKGLREFNRRFVLQYGPNSIRLAATAKAALQSLVERGWLATDDGCHFQITSDALTAQGELAQSPEKEPEPDH
jgi:phage/plasmid primase-like uncharacterized protein